MSRIIKPGDPGFYINRKRWHELNADACVGVTGHFSGRAIKPGVGVVREFGTSPNLITNVGMNALGSGGSFIRMHLGTGTATPQFTDTGLQNFGVNVQANNGTAVYSSASVSPWFGEVRITWTSAVGGATGNWSEIGISNQNTNGNLRSRALILDQIGSPTIFPVLADEQFQGTYTFRIYAPQSDVPASILLSSSPYSTVTRAIGVTSANASPGNWGPSIQEADPFIANGDNSRACTGPLVAVTDAQPAGVINNIPAGSSSAYAAGSHYRDSSYRWGSGAGVGTLRTFITAFVSARFQVEYSPTIAKLATEELIINQRVSWARR